MSAPPETILQFGTGKFLRAFADLFVHEANQAGEPAGRVVAVQSTGTDRADLLNRQGGRFHVAVRGLEDGRRIDRAQEVESVSRALAAATGWDRVLEVARSPSLRAIVSNVTEAGYDLDEGDGPDAAPPRSFPAKLLRVLAARFEAGLPGVAVLPCELLDHNGSRLRGLVLDQARRWNLAGPLCQWIEGACRWHDTLVDRIVAAPKPGDPLGADPLAAVAEPFALWLVEGRLEVPGLASHAAVRVVERVEPFALRKVRILNGAHTALVANARPLGIETVREAVDNAGVRAWLERLLFDEIVPVLEGRTEDPAGFARRALERFANPFLDHRLADIALFHETKLKTRLWPTCEEYRARFGHPPRLLTEILQVS